jgi:hypothetical protein
MEVPVTWERIAWASAVVVIALGAWIVGSWKSEPEPAFRHSKLYDECLARGGSIMACDATMRVVAARLKESRQEEEQARIQSCSAKYYEQHPIDHDNPFQKIMDANGLTLAPKECLSPQ